MTERPVRPYPKNRKKLTRENFFSRVDCSGGPDTCWPWTMKSRTSYGYGVFRRDNVLIAAHREAFEIANGPIPEGLYVLHECDNAPCCNPKHLFLGTHLDNIADMIKKGRNARGEKMGTSTHSDAVVAAAVAEFRAGGKTRTAVAKKHGMSSQHLSAILLGKFRIEHHESRSFPATPIPPACSSSFCAKSGRPPIGMINIDPM